VVDLDGLLVDGGGDDLAGVVAADLDREVPQTLEISG
jgi:hypothetical protein